MHRLGWRAALACLTAILVAWPGAALGQASATFTAMRLDGPQEHEAALAGLRLRSEAGLPDASLAGAGERLRLTTVNYTTQGAGVAGTEPARDGGSWSYGAFGLTGGPAADRLDIVLMPLPGQPAPRIATTTVAAKMASSGMQTLTETGHVDTSRPVYSTDVSGLLQSTSGAVSRLRVEGSFRLSVWSWNFTVQQGGAQQDVVTGAWQTPIASAPTGQTLAYEEFAQVAQLEVRDGWLELTSLFGAGLDTYAGSIHVTGEGVAEVAGAHADAGDESGLQLAASTLRLEGRYELDAQGGNVAHLQVDRLVGTLAVDGAPVKLGGDGPLRTSTVQRDGWGREGWAWTAGIAAVMAFLVLVKGPALTGQFNRIQLRFERRDYAGVLARIDPFTRRRRYARRATFLKAVSLLSIGDYREAALFLQGLAPRDGPAPATKSFLQACAAAGLGQDSTVLEHLTSCFRDDPSYIEEARAVPALSGYLAYFSVTDAEGAR